MIMREEELEIAIKVVIVSFTRQFYFRWQALLIVIVFDFQVGNGGVGKSSMIQRYCKGIYTRDYKKTIGVDFLERMIE